MWLYMDGQTPNLVWDRKVEGGFPELKVLVRITYSICQASPDYMCRCAETAHPRPHPTGQVARPF